MATDTAEAQPPGEGSGLSDEEPAGGRVVEHIVRRHPDAYASLYAPSGRRTMWWFCFRCPHCGAGHFGRVREQAAACGTRRTGCGRLVRLVVARTYEPKASR